MRITFHGAAESVTGSRHLIETANNKKILLDCGLFQDKGIENITLNRHFGFDPSSIDYVILSHAHTDHAGNLPFLVQSGFVGPIYSTPATYDLCKIMLIDSAHIQEHDIIYTNKRRLKKGQSLLKPLYDVNDVAQALKQFVPVPLNVKKSIDKGIQFHFTEAGHILGSACVNLELEEENTTRKVFFSGDIGRYNDKILCAPQPFPQADIIICESTYGNRLHDDAANAENKLLTIVKKTCVEKLGKLIIPAFSLGRTQELVYALDRLHTAGLLPHIPVYVDSPLAINATNIMRKHSESFNEEILAYMKKDDDPFGYDDVLYIQDLEDSKALNDLDEPCIIISASGMMDAGRIKHHIKNNIESPKNTILIVGYVTESSLGGKLKSGASEVKIFGEMYKVNASIHTLDSYSAHADYQEIKTFLKCQDSNKVSCTFLVHGDLDALNAMNNHLNEMGFNKIIIPKMGESFNI